MSSTTAREPGAPLLVMHEGSRQHRIYQVVGWACLAIPLLIAPYILPSFRVAQVAQAAGWAVAILGMNMVIGWSGLLSLGHIAFTGLGAYTAAIMINEYRWDFWMTLPISFVVCFVVGCIVGLPALKIKGLYLALVTFALAYTFPILLKIDGGGISRRTGGDNGRTLVEGMKPTSWMRSVLAVDGQDDSTRIAVYKYFAMLLVAFVCFFLVRNIMKSAMGRSMIAIRDNQIGAAVSGVNLNRQKVLVFGISAAFAGIGGAMIAAVLDSVGPTVFDSQYAILTLMGLVLAGVATLHGCWIGGLMVVFLQDFAPRLIKSLPIIHPDVQYAAVIFGLALVLVPFFMPHGILSFLRQGRARFIRVIPAKPEFVPANDAAVTGGAPSPVGATT